MLDPLRVRHPGVRALDRWFEAYLQSKSSGALRYAAAAARRSLRRHVRKLLPKLEQLYLTDLMQTHDAAEGIA